MKKVLFTALALALATISFAQDEQPQGWTHKGNIGLNFGQSSYTNWAAGGQNSINGQGIFNYELRYLKGNFKWDNTLNASLGYSIYDFKKKPIKTDDKIEFTSLAGIKATEHLNYSAELAFRSQFAKGYKYDEDSTQYISKFLAPAYISLGVGAEWVPNKYFSLYFSPLTGRITIVNDDYLASIGAFGVNDLDKNDTTVHAKGAKVRYEFGARAVAKVQVPIAKNIDFNSKLELFSNYLNHPERIDVDWQNMLVLKVNDWLNANLATHLIYDYDIPFYDEAGARINGSKVQFKEVLAIGIMINLK
ncbi:MAG: DUF3078 domain-containing protein [Bacteroidales bacterium]|nr:DUF3078 domain-containing protein [Bacteroidales bacterium]